VRVDANSVLGLSHRVSVGDDADISEVLAPLVFRVEVCRLKTEVAYTSENVSIVAHNLTVQQHQNRININN
jgi:hypothetical protein